MRDGGMKSLNSFATHEFTAEAAVDVSRLPEDGHEKCGPWAASGECDANPGYMRASCVRACAVQDARNGSRLEVVFAIAEVSEIVTIKEINGKFVVERTGAVHDARKAVAAAFETCDDAREDETCAGDPAVCVAAELDAFFAPKRGELELEATIFEASVALAPVATPDPKAKKAYIEDLPALRGRIAAARAPVNITDACPGAHKDCVVRTASDAAAVLESAIADARLATRARKQDKRNATCARDIPWTPHEFAVQTDWVWDPAADAALWGAEGAPADVRSPRGWTADGVAAAPRLPRGYSAEARHGDATFGTTPQVPGPEETRRVAHLFRPAALPKAAIVLIDDFLSDEECDAVVAQATPRLQRATHAKDGNQTVVSETRNSQQATVMPANARDLSDPAARLQARSASFANFFSNFSLGLDGQEHLMAVQYNATQEYMLHCDGSCDGTPFRRGGRVATVLMYAPRRPKCLASWGTPLRPSPLHGIIHVPAAAAPRPPASAEYPPQVLRGGRGRRHRVPQRERPRRAEARPGRVLSHACAGGGLQHGGLAYGAFRLPPQERFEVGHYAVASRRRVQRKSALALRSHGGGDMGGGPARV